MSIRSLLPLGQPPRDDVDAAARLWLGYRRIGISTDGAEVFWRSVSDPDAVEARAEALGACPHCSSTNVIPIRYGEQEPGGPSMLDTLGPYLVGGCLVSADAPTWFCRACRRDFGRLGDVLGMEETNDG